MAIRNPAWYNASESRDYPVDDTATCMPDVGERLPQDIVADLRLRWPNDLGKYAFISAVTVTEGAVTVAFQVATTMDNADGSFVPLAAISLPRSGLEVRRHYALQAQYPGVAGYIVFGNGINRPYRGKFSAPNQSLLTPRAARAYEQFPIPSMRKLYQQTGLTGLVLLKGNEPVEVVKESRDIGFETQDVVVIRLKEEAVSSLDSSVFQLYAGPCSGRPESKTCGQPEPIEFINAVGPDCEGRIEIEFKGCAVVGRNIDNCSIVIDCGFGLTESCLPPFLPDHQGLLPGEYTFIPAEPPIPPEPPIDEPESISDSIVMLGELPYVDCFAGASAYFVVHEGQFLFVTDAGATSEDCPGILYCYASEGIASVGARNVALWEGFDVTTLFRQVSTELKLMPGPTGASHNGGLILNYRPHAVYSGRNVYYIAEIDCDHQEFRIQRFNGIVFRPAVAVSVAGLRVGDWYRITTQVAPHGPSVAITARLEGITDPSLQVVLGPMLTNNYLPATGLYGLGSDRAETRFAYFKVEEWPGA